MDYFTDIESYFERNGLKKPVGCSSAEITSLEGRLGFTLPAAYKEYLLLMGNDYDGVMVGSNCFLDDVESNSQYLPSLLEENKLNYRLPQNYLAFFNHQGYILAWFALPCKDKNPICYFYSEGSTESPVEYGRFKQFMTKDILGNAKISIELRPMKKWWQFWR